MPSDSESSCFESDEEDADALRHQNLGMNQQNAYSISNDNGSSNLVAAPSSNTNSSFYVGQRVRARWEQKTTYYTGVIKEVHEDDTYDILYDDGDTENDVEVRFIKVDLRAARKEMKILEKLQKKQETDASLSHVDPLAVASPKVSLLRLTKCNACLTLGNDECQHPSSTFPEAVTTRKRQLQSSNDNRSFKRMRIRSGSVCSDAESEQTIDVSPP
jgi:hypothetical protein